MKMKGSDGKEYDSGPCLKIIGQRFIQCALLPARHIMKVKEFSVKLLPPQKAGDAWFVDGPRFMLPAGEYKLRCELELPGCSVTRADGQQATPADGEWTGTLKSGEVDLRIAPATDAAKKPRTASNPGQYTLGANAVLSPFASIPRESSFAIEVSSANIGLLHLEKRACLSRSRRAIPDQPTVHRHWA